MRDAACAGLIALDFFALAVPGFLGSSALAFAIATALLVAINVGVLWLWPRGRSSSGGDAEPSPTAGLLVGAAGLLLLWLACREWIHQILIYPNDAQRADMLIVVQQGIRRVLQGRNPYTIYHVPWEATLPYGPVLWVPYIVPYTLHADVRFISIIGELFVPAAGVLTAAGLAWTGRHAAAWVWLAVVLAIAFGGDLRGFVPIAHTPSYWPLLALFAWLVTRERWRAASIACGLLIVGRTTMISIAPVLLLAIGIHDRRRLAAAALLLIACAVAPYLPFFVADPKSLLYAVYGSYQSVMKTFVWTSTTWAHESIGITGLLLRAHLERFVEATQLTALAVVYALAWRGLRRGDRPLPWMALALLAFCMTTLWSVHYIYLDVFLLLACGALAETEWFAQRRPSIVWGQSFAATMLVVALAALTTIPRNPAVDVGERSDRAWLYRGFADDEHGDRSFAWVEGAQADVLLARRTRSDATIEVVCQPNLPSPHSTQTMSAVLNGVVLGTAALREGWQTVALNAPARAWQIGVNELQLSFSNAVSPKESGTGEDQRRLSVAFDRLTVRTK